MAHINYKRNVRYSNKERLSELMPQSNINVGFAALCGNDAQRHAAGLLGISRCLGRIGVVILQNDPVFSSRVGKLQGNVDRHNTRFLNVNPPGGECNYDPFYGTSERCLINTLIPQENTGYGAISHITLKGTLSAYLEIMQTQFKINPCPFGDYPFSLDLLIQLTRMPVQKLYDTVLRYLPEPLRSHIYSRLCHEKAQQQISDLVSSYAKDISGSLWKERGFSGHTCISVSEAVLRRDLINISIPTLNEVVLRTVAEELNSLRENSVPFLLVVCNVPLASAPQIRQFFTEAHSNLNYSTGLLEENISRFSEDGGDISSLLTEHGEILAFRCISEKQAEPLMQAFGTYRRIVTEYHDDVHRKPFGLFSATGKGTTTRETQEYNLSAEELIRLENGGILCGNLYPTPIVVRNIVL